MEIASRPSSPSYRRKFLVGLSILLLGGLAPAHSKNAGKLPATNAIAAEDAPPSPAKSFSCLPKDVRADEAVSYGMKGQSILTVEKKLTEMKARCRRGKLVDAKGREIRFFRPSCWGNPPDNYQETQKRENEELAKLKTRYAVIVFGCNPMIQ